MPIAILSPYSGKPVKVRDQDVGRAIRDEEGRIFYIVQPEGAAPYASMTRKGSDKDEQRYRKLEDGSATLSQAAREQVHAIHDATGKKRRNPVGLLLVLLVLALLAAAAYVYVARPDLVPWLAPPDDTQDTTPGSAPGTDPEGNRPAEGTTGAGQVAVNVLQPRIVPTPGRVPRHTQTTPGPGPATDPEAFNDPPLDPGVPGPVPAPVAVSEPEEPTAEATWRPGAAAPVPPPAADPLADFRVTRTGLRYRVIEPGTGQPALAGHVVSVRYTARDLGGRSLIDDARHTFVLGAGQAIRALDEGLAGVRPGGQRELFVPRGHSVAGALPGVEALPDEAFVLDVQLLSVRPGVTMVVEQAGVGRAAEPGDTIELDYAGWVEGRGDPFDTSEQRGGPMTLVLGESGVIPGLDAGLVGIRLGEVRELTIPPYLGYGEAGVAGGLIPPDAVLTFRVRARSVRAGGE